MTGWRREPLVHFVVLGAILFALAQWRGGGAGANAIVITPGQVDAMVATFTRTWQRPPTDEELKGLIDDSVREELAVREAVALGLDRDDTVIRRRLRQKVEFIVEGEVDATPVTDAELQAYFRSPSGSLSTGACAHPATGVLESGPPPWVDRRRWPCAGRTAGRERRKRRHQHGWRPVAASRGGLSRHPERDCETVRRGLRQRGGEVCDRHVDGTDSVRLRPARRSSASAWRVARRISTRCAPRSNATCERSGARSTSTPYTSTCYRATAW